MEPKAKAHLLAFSVTCILMIINVIEVTIVLFIVARISRYENEYSFGFSKREFWLFFIVDFFEVEVSVRRGLRSLIAVKVNERRAEKHLKYFATRAIPCFVVINVIRFVYVLVSKTHLMPEEEMVFVFLFLSMARLLLEGWLIFTIYKYSKEHLTDCVMNAEESTPQPKSLLDGGRQRSRPNQIVGYFLVWMIGVVAFLTFVYLIALFVAPFTHDISKIHILLFTLLNCGQLYKALADGIPGALETDSFSRLQSYFMYTFCFLIVDMTFSVVLLFEVDIFDSRIAFLMVIVSIIRAGFFVQVIQLASDLTDQINEFKRRLNQYKIKPVLPDTFPSKYL